MIDPPLSAEPLDSKVDEAAGWIRDRIERGSGGRVGLVLGSGLGPVAEDLLDTRSHEWRYDEIPHFPSPGVSGHRGRLIVGTISSCQLLILQGRAHYYEGHDCDAITRPVRTLLQLGVETLLLTNAAGGIRSDLGTGDLMLIEDHLGFLPTRRPGTARQAPAVWSSSLRSAAQNSAADIGQTLHCGVYAMMPGPNYETPAEVRMLRTLGADAVGMSTVPEALACAGRARLLGISCITNPAAGLGAEPITHEDVDAVGRAARNRLAPLLRHLLTRQLSDPTGGGQ